MDDKTRRVDQIEAEIAETRVEMSETIEAIQERLSPSNIVANATETMRQAASEKVRQMTDNSFMDTVRANPIPAAMIGIGAAWLYFRGKSESRDHYYPASNRDPRNVERHPGVRDDGGYASTAGAVGTRGYSPSVADLGPRLRETAEDVRDTARETTRRAQLKFNDVLRDNPLMLGAAAALIGAAVGTSIPVTEAENHLMGETRDAVVARAQSVASDAADKVSEVTGEMEEVAEKAVDSAMHETSTETPAGPRRTKRSNQV